MNTNNAQFEIKICLPQGNVCNICYSHIEDGDCRCPNGHERGKEYYEGKEAFNF